MRIKITKCSKDSYWYKSYIGEVFEVYDSNEGWHRVDQRDTGAYSYSVHKEDSEEIQEESNES